MCTESQCFIGPKQLRAGWSEAFANMQKGEDEMLLPDCADNDGDIEL